MANRTVKDAHSVKGTNPQYLVEKIIRTRIYECRYWKEECFALTGNQFKHMCFETENLSEIIRDNQRQQQLLAIEQNICLFKFYSGYMLNVMI